MYRYCLLSVCLTFSFFAKAQTFLGKDSVIAAHFFNLPVQAGFNSVLQKLESHPQFGIDSVTTGTVTYFSSVKKDHSRYPFPPDARVEILVTPTLFRDSLTQQPYDTAMRIVVGCTFPATVAGQQACETLYNQLVQTFRNLYQNNGASEWTQQNQPQKWAYFKRDGTAYQPEVNIYQNFSARSQQYAINLVFYRRPNFGYQPEQ